MAIQLTRLQYVQQREALMREHGENSQPVQQLDRAMSMQHTLNNAGSTLVDNSNQSNQGAQRAPTAQLSQSQKNEIEWFNNRIANSGTPRTSEDLKDLYNEDGGL